VVWERPSVPVLDGTKAEEVEDKRPRVVLDSPWVRWTGRRLKDGLLSPHVGVSGRRSNQQGSADEKLRRTSTEPLYLGALVWYSADSR